MNKTNFKKKGGGRPTVNANKYATCQAFNEDKAIILTDLRN